MMATILTLIILGMVFQGAMVVVDSVLDTIKVNDTLKSIPIVGGNLNLIWAYLFVLISQINGENDVLNLGFGTNMELLSLGRFGMDVATAIVLVAFIPVRDAAISALKKGIGGRGD
ncbi:MAG: hypothetical protein F4091_04545 [Acidimicrobiales bacterium]|nr:hypothetical protein [Acidimicrobiales bacterium]MYD83033.1 hypothetical protein [Acidimicrobiales bacterium]MYJ64723.1 hypothetical protein [Acidimicrobiales bacterium]